MNRPQLTNKEIKRMVEDLGVLELINEEVARHLGVACNFVFSDDYSLGLKDTAGAADKELTATPFLRNLFKSAFISAYCDLWEWNGVKEFSAQIQVSYRHPQGGSNGRTLGTVYVNLDTERVLWRGF